MFAFIAGGVAVVLFLAMLLSLEMGRRVGVRRLARDPEGARLGTAAIEGAVFALLGLLIAFTFSGAVSRFDMRRQLIVKETNAIGTAYLRLDVLPTAAQPALRDSFRRYVDTRLEAYRKLPDIAAARQELAKSTAIQNDIWTQAVAACRNSQPATILLLPSINQMIDVTSERTMAGEMHPPMVVFAMLILLTLAGALIAGYATAGCKTRSWIHLIGFAAVIALTVYVIVDIEYPRLGLIRVEAFDRALGELRASMK